MNLYKLICHTPPSRPAHNTKLLKNTIHITMDVVEGINITTHVLKAGITTYVVKAGITTHVVARKHLFKINFNKY